MQYINTFSLVHFTLWAMIGLSVPNQYGLAVLLSVLWEVVEGYSAHHPTIHALLEKYWVIPEKYWNEGLGNKIMDVVANLAGYYWASRIRVYIPTIYLRNILGILLFGVWGCAIIYAKTKT